MDGLPDDAAHDASKIMKSTMDEKTDMTEEKASNEPLNPAELQSTTPSNETQQDIATQVLEFLGDASTGVIAGITGTVSVVLYFMLGRVGLVLIGALAGVTAYAHFQSQAGGSKRHNESTADILQRILDWRDTQKALATELLEDSAEIDDKNDFKDFRPETAEALNDIVEATIDGYVKWWYSPIIPGELKFPREARKTLVSFLRSISWRLTRKRPAEAFLDFLTNTTSIVIVFFGELANAIKETSEIEVAPEDAVRLYLAENPDSNLAHIMDEKQQQKKFELIADDLLSNFIDKAVYDCAPAKTFLQQILSGVVMEMSLKTMSKPEWLNGWIVYLLEEGEPNLVQAIDAGISGESNAAAKSAGPKTNVEGATKPGHQKNMSKADGEMEEAMKEARRLSQLIAEEDMRRLKENFATSPPIIEEEVAPALPDRPVIETKSTNDSPEPATHGSDQASIISSKSTIDETGSAEEPKSQFTSFDQMPLLVPSPQIEETTNRQSMPPLTLHKANITIMDDSDPKDKGRLRNKPQDDYLVQIEPRDSRHPGWMIVRKYDDFETLHEVLKRIAQVSGASNFNKNWATLPPWKNETKSNVRIGLENYLFSACQYQPLAESVGLKRFLEKEHQGPTGKGSQGIGWPTPAAFETMGKGLVDNLMSVSKGAADGGKSVFGGVTNVFNRNRSASKVSLSSQNQKNSRSSLSISGWSSEEKPKSTDSPPPVLESAVESIMTAEPEQITTKPSLEKETVVTQAPIGDISGSALDGTSDEAVNHMVDDLVGVNDEEKKKEPLPPIDIDTLLLPPPPSDIPDDYGVNGSASSPIQAQKLPAAEVLPRTSTNTAASMPLPSELPFDAATNPKGMKKEVPPFSEEETRVALELIFAMINELYTLSSAWGLRRTLLTAAKTFLLRPGNPSLASITDLIQTNIIAANTSDSGIAAHLKTIRVNSLPTEEERKAWPEEMPEWEKEKLRTKARKMLLERGVPPALRGVMGNVATGEALGRVFDGLQDERVLRGLMFGVLLQGVRVLTH